MITSGLGVQEILGAYDAVSALYPHLPSMSAWRACEYAGYRRFRLIDPVLDIGCGDGRFFKLLWPDIHAVDGIDFDPGTAEAARRSGVYRNVLAVAADAMPTQAQGYASAFANCSLEHMNNLPRVLSAIAGNLRRGAPLVLSVVTDKFLEWQMLPVLMTKLGSPALAEKQSREHIAYHNLVNALPVAQWVEQLERAGFEVVEHVPIVAELMSRLVLLFDELWHVKQPDGELGTQIHGQITRLSGFPQAYKHVLRGVLEMDANSAEYSGAILKAVKK